MCDDHKHVDIVYTLANEALALYDDFDEQIFQKLNNQWQSCQLMLTTTGAAARGKERCPVLRPAVILFMLYSYTTYHLYQSHGPVPRVISKACMKFDFLSLETATVVKARSVETSRFVSGRPARGLC